MTIANPAQRKTGCKWHKEITAAQTHTNSLRGTCKYHFILKSEIIWTC